jgi:hypothetical protein
MIMDSSLTGKGFFDGFSAALTTLLINWIKRLFGPNADNTVFGLITWADMVAVLCFMLLVLIVNGLAALMVRHKTKRPMAAGVADLQHHLFGALGKPLYALIWAYGIYFATTPLLLKLKPDEGLRVVRAFFDNVFDLGVFGVLFWFFFRFMRVPRHDGHDSGLKADSIPE